MNRLTNNDHQRIVEALRGRTADKDEQAEREALALRIVRAREVRIGNG